MWRFRVWRFDVNIVMFKLNLGINWRTLHLNSSGYKIYLNTFRIVGYKYQNIKILCFSFILLQNLFSKYMYNFHLSKNAQHSVGTNSRHALFFILYFNAVLNIFNSNPLHHTKKTDVDTTLTRPIPSGYQPKSDDWENLFSFFLFL